MCAGIGSARRVPRDERPTIGMLIARERQVWRVIEVTDVPDTDWTEPERQARPAGSLGTLSPCPSIMVLPPAEAVRPGARMVPAAAVPSNGEPPWRGGVTAEAEVEECEACREPIPGQVGLRWAMRKLRTERTRRGYL